MFLVLLAYLAFFSIALPDSMLGVAWPSMRIDFGLPIAAAGLVPPLGVAATLVSTGLSARISARFGVGRLLAASTVLSASALALSAASQSFTQFLLSVVLLGFSGGAIDATLNSYAASNFGPRRINLLHASYVAGAAASPLLVTAVVQSGAPWRWAFAAVAVVQLALGLVFWLTRHRWTPAAPQPRPASGIRDARTVPGRRTDVAVGLVAVAVQTGIESSVALWAYSHLTGAAGVAPALAGALASGYWLAMFAARVVLGSVAERVGPWPVMAVAACGLVVAAGLSLIGGATTAMAAVLLFGLSAAPIYPLLTLTTSERTSMAVADSVVGFQAGASSVGAAVFPLLVGLAMERLASGFGIALVALCGTAAGLQLTMQVRRRTRAHSDA